MTQSRLGWQVPVRSFLVRLLSVSGVFSSRRMALLNVIVNDYTWKQRWFYFFKGDISSGITEGSLLI